MAKKQAKKTVSKPKKGHLVEGALIGAALVVAAGIFANTKSGKKVTKQIRKTLKSQSADFYRYIAPKIKKASKMSEVQYKAFIKKAMVSYGKSRKLSTAETTLLMKQAQAMWEQLKKKIK